MSLVWDSFYKQVLGMCTAEGGKVACTIRNGHALQTRASRGFLPFCKKLDPVLWGYWAGLFFPSVSDHSPVLLPLGLFKLFEVFKDHLHLVVMTFDRVPDIFQLLEDLLMISDHLTHLGEQTHDLDVDIYCRFTVQNA